MKNKGKTCPEGKYGKGEKIKKHHQECQGQRKTEEKVRRDRIKGYRGKLK